MQIEKHDEFESMKNRPSTIGWYNKDEKSNVISVWVIKGLFSHLAVSS